MPISAPHPCGAPGCPVLVPRGQPRCPVHTKSQNAQRGSFRERGYTWAEWDGPQGLRVQQLRAHPLCELCEAQTPSRVTPANTVDHRRAWQSGSSEAEQQALRTDPLNLVSMCSSCHGKKTAAEDGSFGGSTRHG